MTQVKLRPYRVAGQPAETVHADGAALLSVPDMVVRRFRLLARRRAAWLRKLWEEEGAPGDERLITHAEVDALLDGRDNPADQQRWVESDPALAQVNRELHETEDQLAQDTSSRLAALTAIFGLSAHERDLLEACLAIGLEPSLGRVAAYLHDHAGMAHITAGLAARVYGHDRPLLLDTTALSFWQLVRQEPTEPGHEQAVTVDMWVSGWLSGGSALDRSLAAAARQVGPGEMPGSWPVAQTAAAVRRSLELQPPVPVRVSVTGQHRGGRTTFAAAVAAAVGMKALAVDTDRVADSEWRSFAVRAVLFALLNNAAVVWKGDRLFNRPWPEASPPLQFVACEAGQSLPPADGVADHAVELASPPVEERQALWRLLLPASQAWPARDLQRLAERHRAWPGDIAAAALHRPASADAASSLVRQKGWERLGSLARRIETPFRFSDLVIHAPLRNAVEDIIFEARERAAFWENQEARRLFPQGRGLLALMSGPPGTGKTMAAQVIAAELGLDLFRIDLSSVVSKWVGETSKNLERVLSTAAQMDVVLLFDEADALFGKRTEISDAHDRFANTDTNYLLQAIENYEGVAVLASNRKAEIDHAFIRRLRHVLEFREPDAGQRLEIWRHVVAELTGPEQAAALDADLQVFARELEVTGAQIKYAVLSAMFIAKRAGRPLSASGLVTGLDRELMKSGRGLSERDKERLVRRG